MWRKSQPLAIVLGNNELWVPPFENYFGVRNGMLWADGSTAKAPMASSRRPMSRS